MLKIDQGIFVFNVKSWNSTWKSTDTLVNFNDLNMTWELVIYIIFYHFAQVPIVAHEFVENIIKYYSFFHQYFFFFEVGLFSVIFIVRLTQIPKKCFFLFHCIAGC